MQEIVNEYSGTQFRWSADEGERRKLWQARHSAHWAAVGANPGKLVISTDLAVPLSKLGEAIAVAESILGDEKYPYSILGHVADGNFHCQIMTDPTLPDELIIIRKLIHEMTLRILAMGGTCTGEHGIGAGKIEALAEEAGPGAIEVMQMIKAMLDPHSILNPGKILPPIK